MPIFEEPPRDAWTLLLEKFVRDKKGDTFESLSNTLRAELLKLGVSYNNHLLQQASKCGITLSEVELPRNNSSEHSQESKIVMSGHQSVLYHPGLLYKEECLEEFSATTGTLPIHIVIDTDEGAAGAMLIPTPDDYGQPFGSCRRVQQKEVDLTGDSRVFLSQKLLPTRSLEPLFDSVNREISSLEFPVDVVNRVRLAGELYSKLGGLPVVEAHSIVRWALRGRRHLEVPYSKLLELPTVVELIKSWITQGADLLRCYNETLEEFRESRKIKNPANPFPNMSRREGAYELPFWIVSPAAGSRSAVVIFEGKGEPQLPDGSFLAPRGSITTLLLRGFCSDLFIHGRGGAKYDPFVEQFAGKMFGLTLAPFVVASQDLRPFSREFQLINEGEDIKARFKELISHTAKYLEADYFSASEREALTILVAKRSDALARIQSASNAADKSTVAHELNAINREVRAIIDSGEIGRKLQVFNQPEERLKAWSARDYPFFFS